MLESRISAPSKSKSVLHVSLPQISCSFDPPGPGPPPHHCCGNQLVLAYRLRLSEGACLKSERPTLAKDGGLLNETLAYRGQARLP